MADKKNNALSHLARKLNADIDIALVLTEYISDKENELVGAMIQDISKARRIIKELAKAYEPGFPIESSDDIIDRCRAIAEEGVNNGK